MTKPREKTREELTAEIEEGKKKIRQFENREKIIKQKLSVEERKARNHRLCKRGGFMESLVPELIAMPDEDAKAFLRLALMSEPAQEFLKKRAGDGIFDFTQLGQRKYLKSTAVCKNRLVPVHELMKSAHFVYNVVTRSDVQMIGIAKLHLRFKLVF